MPTDKASRTGRTPGSGRKANGPNGEPRNKLAYARVAETEEQTINQLLRHHGIPTTSTGLRTFLLGPCSHGLCEHPPLALEYAIAA